jgi:hypothetical protein
MSMANNMEDEKMLPKGEPGIEVNALPVLRSYTAPEKPAPSSILPPPAMQGMPSPAAQQWGVIISIVIIVLMIIIGAFYAWGQRIEQNQIFTSQAATQ